MTVMTSIMCTLITTTVKSDGIVKKVSSKNTYGCESYRSVVLVETMRLFKLCKIPKKFADNAKTLSCLIRGVNKLYLREH